MSRKRKMTNAELGEQLANIFSITDMINQRIDFLAEAVMGDFERFNILMMNMLKHYGHIEEKECAKEDCGTSFTWINIGGLTPEPDLCQTCNSKEIDELQAKIEEE